MDEFLAQLQLRASCAAVDQVNLTRVAQLTNKTNQFNLTTRRYTEAQVQNLASETGNWAAAFHLADRMGEYGLIGVIFCRPRQAGQWEIDTWLMSCRVLGRQMEKFMFDRLIRRLRARNPRIDWRPARRTPKNGLVRDHFDKLGLRRSAKISRRASTVAEYPPSRWQEATHPERKRRTIRGNVIQFSNSGCRAAQPIAASRGHMAKVMRGFNWPVS